jgi:putative endonuclease
MNPISSRDRATANEPEWHPYLIRTRDGSLYTGIAADVARRFAEHQAEDGTGAR